MIIYYLLTASPRRRLRHPDPGGAAAIGKGSRPGGSLRRRSDADCIWKQRTGFFPFEADHGGGYRVYGHVPRALFDRHQGAAEFSDGQDQGGAESPAPSLLRRPNRRRRSRADLGADKQTAGGGQKEQSSSGRSWDPGGARAYARSRRRPAASPDASGKAGGTPPPLRRSRRLDASICSRPQTLATPYPVPKWWNWQTRHLEGVVGKPVGVRVPPSAPNPATFRSQEQHPTLVTRFPILRSFEPGARARCSPAHHLFECILSAR